MSGKDTFLTHRLAANMPPHLVSLLAAGHRIQGTIRLNAGSDYRLPDDAFIMRTNSGWIAMTNKGFCDTFTRSPGVPEEFAGMFRTAVDYGSLYAKGDEAHMASPVCPERHGCPEEGGLE